MERRYFTRLNTDIDVDVYDGRDCIGPATVRNLSVEGVRLQWSVPDPRPLSILEIEFMPASGGPPQRVPLMVLWQNAMSLGGVFAEAGCFERLRRFGTRPVSAATLGAPLLDVPGRWPAPNVASGARRTVPHA